MRPRLIDKFRELYQHLLSGHSRTEAHRLVWPAHASVEQAREHEEEWPDSPPESFLSYLISVGSFPGVPADEIQEVRDWTQTLLHRVEANLAAEPEVGWRASFGGYSRTELLDHIEHLREVLHHKDERLTTAQAACAPMIERLRESLRHKDERLQQVLTSNTHLREDKARLESELVNAGVQNLLTSHQGVEPPEMESFVSAKPSLGSPWSAQVEVSESAKRRQNAELEDMNRRFPPTRNEPGYTYRTLALYLMRMPQSHERSIALTKLEESFMWAMRQEALR